MITDFLRVVFSLQIGCSANLLATPYIVHVFFIFSLIPVGKIKKKIKCLNPSETQWASRQRYELKHKALREFSLNFTRETIIIWREVWKSTLKQDISVSYQHWLNTNDVICKIEPPVRIYVYLSLFRRIYVLGYLLVWSRLGAVDFKTSRSVSCFLCKISRKPVLRTGKPPQSAITVISDQLQNFVSGFVFTFSKLASRTALIHMQKLVVLIKGFFL